VAEPRVGEGTAIEQRVVQRVADCGPRSIPTPLVEFAWGSVDEQRLAFRGGERRGEVHRRRRLPTPPFWLAIAMTRDISKLLYTNGYIVTVP